MSSIHFDEGLKMDPTDSNVRYSSIRDGEGKVVGHVKVTAIQTFKLEVTFTGDKSPSITAADMTSKSFEAAAYEAACMAADEMNEQKSKTLDPPGS